MHNTGEHTQLAQQVEQRLIALRAQHQGYAEKLLGRGTQRADDAIQEAHFKIWEYAMTGRYTDQGGTQFAAYAVRIIRNTCIDILRRPAREFQADESHLEHLAVVEAVKENTIADQDAETLFFRRHEANEARERIYGAMVDADLTDLQADCLFARLNGDAPKDTAKRLDIGTDSVRANARHAWKKLAAVMGEEENA